MLTVVTIMICRLYLSEFKLVNNIRSHCSLPNAGPKTYIGRQSLTNIVDIYSYSLLQLVDFIGEHFMWGSKQYISFWQSVEDAYIEIKSDENLLQWFELNQEIRVVNMLNLFHICVTC
jgi:hypothetical protein